MRSEPVKLRCIALSLVYVSLNLVPRLTASESPGRMGVYVSFEKESNSPEALRQTMKRIKDTGIDFIHCSGKGHGIYWDSQVAPKELVEDRAYMEKVLQCAHEEGLKVYPVFCVATEGGALFPDEQEIRERLGAVARFYGNLVSAKYGEPFVMKETMLVEDVITLGGRSI